MNPESLNAIPPKGKRHRRALVISIFWIIALIIAATIAFSVGVTWRDSKEVEEDPIIQTNDARFYPEELAGYTSYDGVSFEEKKPEPKSIPVAEERVAPAPKEEPIITPEPPKPEKPKPPSQLEQVMEERKIAMLRETFEAWESGGTVEGLVEKINALKPQGLAGDDANYLNHRLHEPVSPYILHEGTIIPAILQTGINSDLPGQITALVSSNVYDSIGDGEDYLLIPQGTRLVGAYDANQAYGQERVFVGWNRLIFPNGDSLKLGRMNGADLEGYSGSQDKVNHHWGRLITGIVLGSLLTAGTNISRSDNQTVVSDAQRAVAGSTSTALDNLVQRQLNIQPTIEIRPGSRVNVFVNKDIILKEYEG